MIIITWLCILGAPATFADVPTDAATDACAARLLPREIDPAAAFEDLVTWVHDEVIVRRGAPGLVVGISGTDSILAFLAVARAYARAGRPARAVGLHFGDPREPTAWFRRDVIPWLKSAAPGARVLIDTSIDHERDGLRWGALLDWSTRGDRHWVVGTRNASETALGTYSNLARACSVQPLTHLWKSEVLEICRHLGAPAAVLGRSVVADCACGREDLPALHIPEVDALLIARAGQIPVAFARRTMGERLFETLDRYVNEQIATTAHKSRPPLEFDGAVRDRRATTSPAELAELKADLANEGFNGRGLTSLVPTLIREGRANVAADLVTSPSPSRAAWLPEALTLFNVPGLRGAQLARMIERTFGVALDSTPLVHRLAKLSGRLGYLGFSFARWRFLFKRYENLPSLAERRGFRALDRSNDRDLGPGFTLTRGPWTIEFRQAYIMVSNSAPLDAITLVLRNNSPVYGRDLLFDAGYVAAQSFDAPTLESFDAERLERDVRFVALDRLVTGLPQLKIGEKLRRLERAVAYVDDVELQLDDWLRRRDGGLNALTQLLTRATRDVRIFLAVTPAGEPAWRPAHVTKVDAELIRRIEREGRVTFPAPGAPGRLTMMSGEAGDFP